MGRTLYDKIFNTHCVRQTAEGRYQVYNEGTFFAWLELAVSARTDANLRKVVSVSNMKYVEAMGEIWNRAFPADSAYPSLARDLEWLINGQLMSMAIWGLLGNFEETARLSDARELVKILGQHLIRLSGAKSKRDSSDRPESPVAGTTEDEHGGVKTAITTADMGRRRKVKT